MTVSYGEAGAPTACEWPGCDEPPAVCAQLGVEPWYCWTHITDDFLPPVAHGVRSVCVRCRMICVTWIVRWPEADDICLHERCRRGWVRSGQRSEAPVSTSAKGAYARRS